MCFFPPPQDTSPSLQHPPPPIPSFTTFQSPGALPFWTHQACSYPRAFVLVFLYLQCSAPDLSETWRWGLDLNITSSKRHSCSSTTCVIDDSHPRLPAKSPFMCIYFRILSVSKHVQYWLSARMSAVKSWSRGPSLSCHCCPAWSLPA